MATETSGGGSGWLAFVVGALVVIVALVGYMVWSGGGARAPASGLNIKVEAPHLPKLPTPEVPAAPPQSVPH